MKFFANLFGGLVSQWQAFLGVAIVCLGLGSFGTYKVMHNANQAGKVQQATATVRLVEHQANIQMNLGTLYVPQFVFIQTETNDAAKEIPKHVTPEIDRAYPVPLGFVRVWNSRTDGPIPPAAAGSDADPSGTPLSTVAGAHNDDVGALKTCLKANAEWWDWYDQHSVAWDRSQK